MTDSLMRMSTTPGDGISKPHEGLCVTCKHHGTRHHSFMSSYEVHGAQFLTCKVRTVRSAVNGATSDWCHEIRADGAVCGQWENDRDCARCKHAGYSRTQAQCRHPSKEMKFETGEFKGQSYWPDQRGHTWKTTSPDMLVMVYNDDVACGKDAPLWEERE